MWEAFGAFGDSGYHFLSVCRVSNLAIEKLTQFRAHHIEFATLYILKPAQTTEAVGTGGTPFTFYLKKHINQTKAHRL